MDWYAIVDSTGALVSTGTDVATDAELAGRGLQKILLGAEPDFAREEWDEVARRFRARPAPPDPVAAFEAEPTVNAILARLTPGERSALREKLTGRLR